MDSKGPKEDQSSHFNCLDVASSLHYTERASEENVNFKYIMLGITQALHSY